MIDIILEKNKNKYLQIYNQIKNGIITNKIKPDEKLPSKRVLANALNVSINTIIEAYNLLLDEGFIISIPKKGFYVVNYNISNNKENIEYIINNDNKHYKYDFTTKNIDSSIFPFYTIAKISKNLITNDYSLLYKTPNLGDFELRNSISKYLYNTKSINVNPNNIIIGSGIEYLLGLLVNIIPKKRYRIENPGYKKLKRILENNSCLVSFDNVDNEGLKLSNLDFDVLYLTPANQFPAGIKMSLKRKAYIIEKCVNKYIIEDDFDSEFKYHANNQTTLFSLSNNVIYMSTFSRTISPSLRLSYMILPNSLLEIYLNKYKDYSSTASTLDQKIIKEFIDSGAYSRHINKTKNLNKEKREKIIEILNSNNYYPFDGGYLSLMLKTPYNNKLKLYCNQNDIDITLLDDYYFNNEKTSTIIIGYSSINMSDIEKGLELLIESIKKAN